MIWIALAAAVPDSESFGAAMDRYLACLSAGEPSDLSQRDLQARARIYQKAAARCQHERQDAIDAAVGGRRQGISEAEARAEAIDIIDTLDPMSSCRVPGAQC